MFVDVGQLVENPQRVHGGTFNSLVRLRPLNQCQCALIDPTSDRDLANVVLLAVVDDPVFMDRERRAIRWRTFGGEHQLTGSVLESESHLVDALADDHADTHRDRDDSIDRESEPQRVLRWWRVLPNSWDAMGVRIELQCDELTLAIPPFSLVRFQLVQVLACLSPPAVDGAQVDAHGLPWEGHAKDERQRADTGDIS